MVSFLSTPSLRFFKAFLLVFVENSKVGAPEEEFFFGYFFEEAAEAVAQLSSYCEA